MKPVSNKQLSILTFIYQAIEDQGYPPTIREICTAVDLASTSTVHGHLSRLERDGFLIKDSSKTRALELTEQALDLLGIQSDKIPLLGQVAAGSPILAVEEATDYFPIPDELRHFDPSELFVLQIKGESMINIGIMDGDLVTVRKQPSASNGEVVIALTDEDEATCKTFYKRSDAIVLHPENDHMDDIILPNVTILGKVVSLTRFF